MKTKEELKTLKDMKQFQIFSASGRRITDEFFIKLKQEAIKWVKYYLKYGSELRDFTAWRLFFNITEEDLI